MIQPVRIDIKCIAKAYRVHDKMSDLTSSLSSEETSVTVLNGVLLNGIV